MNETERALKHFSKESEKCKRRIEDCPSNWPAQKRTLEILAGYYETALSALRAQAERDNPQALTLERLAERNGNPVWLSRAKEWAFIASVNIEPYAQVWYFSCKGFAKTILFHHEDFYDYPPKEDRNDEG